MLNRLIKVVLFVVCLVLSVWQFYHENIGNGISLLLLSLFVVLFYFRNENMLGAFFYLKKQNFEKTVKFLDRIKHPEKSLVRGQQAYYYYLRGLAESQMGKPMTTSEKYLKKALKIGLRMKHDRAMAKLNLASIAASKRRKREALNLVAEVKKLDTSKMLSEQVRMLQNQMKKI